MSRPARLSKCKDSNAFPELFADANSVPADSGDIDSEAMMSWRLRHTRSLQRSDGKSLSSNVLESRNPAVAQRSPATYLFEVDPLVSSNAAGL